jgi:hypothetical protein
LPATTCRHKILLIEAASSNDAPARGAATSRLARRQRGGGFDVAEAPIAVIDGKNLW